MGSVLPGLEYYLSNYEGEAEAQLMKVQHEARSRKDG